MYLHRYAVHWFRTHLVWYVSIFEIVLELPRTTKPSKINGQYSGFTSTNFLMLQFRPTLFLRRRPFVRRLWSSQSIAPQVRHYYYWSTVYCANLMESSSRPSSCALHSSDIGIFCTTGVPFRHCGGMRNDDNGSFAVEKPLPLARSALFQVKNKKSLPWNVLSSCRPCLNQGVDSLHVKRKDGSSTHRYMVQQKCYDVRRF